MNQTAQAISKENIDLLWLDNTRNFAQTESLMHHGLPRAVDTRLIIRRACFR